MLQESPCYALIISEFLLQCVHLVVTALLEYIDLFSYS